VNAELEKMKNITVLYCEDEEQLHEVTVGLLRRVVKRVFSAHDGREGLRIYQEHSDEIDMIISDISMPEMDGLEMTRLIKAENPAVPVIVTTAYSSTDHLFEAIDIHVDKYVLKPLDTRKLFNAMKQSLLYHELRALYRDPETGLQTRNALLQYLKTRSPNRLVLMDIEHFAHISDLYGDEIASRVLVELAKRLREEFHESFELYRIGSNGFVLSDNDLNRSNETIREHLEVFAKKCRTSGMHVDEIPVYLFLTFALAYSENGHTLYYAQRAMQKANENHLRYIEYNPKSYGNITDRETNIWWTKELDNAVDSGRFRPFFQPIYNTQTEKIHKYEALIRYTGQQSKIIGPIVFLGIAKKTRLYPVVMRVMLEKVIEVIRTKGVRVAINVSYVDLVDHDTVRYIDQMLQDNPTEAKQIEFEILESEKIDNYDVASAFIQSVKRYGCLVGIDDFGIGYSNFGMIEALRVDYVKINGLLIQGIDTMERQKLIVETIHTFCQKLGIKTVAEMVSNEAEYNVVKSIGIDYTQGWYFSREIDSDEIVDG
jgi:EAL domain-containing protein (putative c-di-GMP-specific phosphodiesterase class I)/DNA-binding response OmpR family regulator